MSEQDRAEWHKEPEQRYMGFGKLEPTGSYRIKGDGHTIADDASEADADRIIADHRTAAKAEALAKALRRARFEGELPDDLMDDVDAALADWAEVQP